MFFSDQLPSVTNYDIYDNLDSILKSRDYFANKGPSSQSYGFSSSMYGCESWAIKKPSTEKLIFLYCGAKEDSWEALGQQGDQTNQS